MVESWPIGPRIVETVIFYHLELVCLETALLEAFVNVGPATSLLLHLSRMVLYPVAALQSWIEARFRADFECGQGKLFSGLSVDD